MYNVPKVIQSEDEVLRQKAKEVHFPLSKEDQETIGNLAIYLIISRNDELLKEYNIRPGVGIAAPQIAKSKRMFAMSVTDFLDEKQTVHVYNIINPVILRKSKEMVYLPGGEGCLSFANDFSGLVARHEKITFTASLYDLKTKKISTKTITLKGYSAIVFQHEFDHLEGILFSDRIDKNLEKAKPLFEIDEDDNDI